MTMTTDFTQREAAIVAELSQRFAERGLEARIVFVKRREDGVEDPTLRFTLDHSSSTDFSRERIAAGGESIESLADEAAYELENPGEPIGP